MPVSLNHWYDGKFYDKVIAPNQDKAFEKVMEIINPGSSVLDVGCGTGRMCFLLNDACGRIDGVDPSLKNISVAEKKRDKKKHGRIKFHHSDIISFLNDNKPSYDFAVLSYVIHEIREDQRAEILKNISLHSANIIIVDYIVPHPKNFTGIVNRAVEFLAGREHYRNFISYLRNGGLKGLSEKTGLIISEEIKNNPPTSHIAVFKK